MSARVAVLAVAACLLAAAVGCGEEEGAAAGATLSVYVDASLCGEAKRQLQSADARAGEFRVRLHCLARSSGAGGSLNLAAVGANARRASEDSTTIAYLEPPGPAARFSTPILEAAGIPSVRADSGAGGMAAVLGAIRAADSGALRESVRAALG
jgi:branched-chain amino acid transport system substrate-binding protein